MGVVEQITYGDTMVRYIESDGAIQGIRVFDYWFRKGQKDGWGNLDNLELLQFTGLLDKNGKEIYEGDIISDGTFTFPVTWDEKECRFNGIDSLEGSAKIIGNIYENPELLK